MSTFELCQKCILPNTYPGIQFNEKGICNQCLATHQIKPKQPIEKLEEMIQSVKKKNNKYDALIGLSGGKDSSYVAYYLKKHFNLNMVGFSYDIGYRSEYAARNLERISDQLDIDLITIRPRQAFLHKLFINFLTRKGEFCSVCNNLGYLIGASFVMQQKKIHGFSPLIVGGWSKRYEFQQNVSVTSMQYFFENLPSALIDELINQPFIEERVVQKFRQIEDPRQAQVGTDAHKKLGDSAMNLVQLPDYIDWDLKEIPHILSKELGWKHPEDVHESHFDCKLFPLKEYLKYKKYGLTQETIKNSVLIREGLMSREEALDRIKLEQRTEPAIMSHFFSKLGIKKGDVAWESEWSV